MVGVGGTHWQHAGGQGGQRSVLLLPRTKGLCPCVPLGHDIPALRKSPGASIEGTGKQREGTPGGTQS